MSFMEIMENFFNKKNSSKALLKLLIGAVTGLSLLLVIFFNLLLPFSSSQPESNTSLLSAAHQSSIPYNDGVDCHSGASALIGLNQWSRPFQKITSVSLKLCLSSDCPGPGYYINNSPPHNRTALSSSLFQQKILLQI
jgi:hypothetical protein